jgi:hypothetical protein
VVFSGEEEHSANNFGSRDAFCPRDCFILAESLRRQSLASARTETQDMERAHTACIVSAQTKSARLR